MLWNTVPPPAPDTCSAGTESGYRRIRFGTAAAPSNGSNPNRSRNCRLRSSSRRKLAMLEHEGRDQRVPHRATRVVVATVTATGFEQLHQRFAGKRVKHQLQAFEITQLIDAVLLKLSLVQIRWARQERLSIGPIWGRSSVSGGLHAGGYPITATASIFCG